MDGMVEENGPADVDPLAHSPPSGNSSTIIPSVQKSGQTQAQVPQRLVTTASIMQITLPSQGTLSVANTPTSQVQSVIQPNKQSVIQTAAGNVLAKGNVIVVKPNTVIQTTPANIQSLQVVDQDSDDDMSPKKRRDVLTRRPSYRKILNEIDEIAGHPGHKVESSSECDSNLDSELSSHSLPTHYQTVIPAGAIQISSQGEAVQSLHTLTMTNATTAGGTIVQYTQGQDGQFYVPGEDGQLTAIVVTQGAGLGSGGVIGGEDQTRKREMRLLKNREAARECRRKKKEYIKCLENRVAVLENQNKALIEELKSLKELYCQQKTE